MDETTTTQPPTPTPVPTRESKDILKSTDFYYLVGALAGLLLLAALVISVVDRMRRRQSAGRAAGASLSLSSFREMYENGEITQGEYEKIRAKMAARMKKDAGVKEPPAVGTTPPPPPAEPGPAS